MALINKENQIYVDTFGNDQISVYALIDHVEFSRKRSVLKFNVDLYVNKNALDIGKFPFESHEFHVSGMDLKTILVEGKKTEIGMIYKRLYEWLVNKIQNNEVQKLNFLRSDEGGYDE